MTRLRDRDNPEMMSVGNDPEYFILKSELEKIMLYIQHPQPTTLDLVAKIRTRPSPQQEQLLDHIVIKLREKKSQIESNCQGNPLPTEARGEIIGLLDALCIIKLCRSDRTPKTQQEPRPPCEECGYQARIDKAVKDARSELEGKHQKEIKDLNHSLKFYRNRCNNIQDWQRVLRDPERQLICEILANGKTLFSEETFAEQVLQQVGSIADQARDNYESEITEILQCMKDHDTRIRKEGADAEREGVLDELLSTQSSAYFDKGIDEYNSWMEAVKSLRAQSPKKEGCK